jgi:hypothetical protein
VTNRCELHDKHIFWSKEEADTRIAEIATEPRTDKIPIRSYYEPGCGWHITSKPAWELRGVQMEPEKARPVRRPRKPKEPVYVTYRSMMPLAEAHPAARATALGLLGNGRKSRLKVLSPTTIIIVNDTSHAKS